MYAAYDNLMFKRYHLVYDIKYSIGGFRRGSAVFCDKIIPFSLRKLRKYW